MRPVGFILEDPAMPRTVFYDSLCQSVRRHPWFRDGEAASLVLPAEDTAQETNWPRYGAQASAYLRGSPPVIRNGTPFAAYLNAIAEAARTRPDRRVLVVNMHPFVRLPRLLKPFRNVIVADGSLAAYERAFNPRTISMPALPIVKPAAAGTAARPILASFTPDDVDRLRTTGADAYRRVFADMDRIVDALLKEAERIPV